MIIDLAQAIEQYGIVAAVAVLMIVVAYLYRDNKSERKMHSQTIKDISKDFRDALGKNSDALTEMNKHAQKREIESQKYRAQMLAAVKGITDIQSRIEESQKKTLDRLYSMAQ